MRPSGCPSEEDQNGEVCLMSHFEASPGRHLSHYLRKPTVMTSSKIIHFSCIWFTPECSALSQGSGLGFVGYGFLASMGRHGAAPYRHPPDPLSRRTCFPSHIHVLHTFPSLVLGDFSHVVLTGSHEDSGLCGSAGGVGAGRSVAYDWGRPGVRGGGGFG